jgi:hypothetical protein
VLILFGIVFASTLHLLSFHIMLFCHNETTFSYIVGQRKKNKVTSHWLFEYLLNMLSNQQMWTARKTQPNPYRPLIKYLHLPKILARDQLSRQQHICHVWGPNKLPPSILSD